MGCGTYIMYTFSKTRILVPFSFIHRAKKIKFHYKFLYCCNPEQATFLSRCLKSDSSTYLLKKQKLLQQYRSSVWRQNTHKMAAQFVVAMVTALRRDCRSAWCVRLAHNRVRNVRRMSRRKKSTHKMVAARKKADGLHCQIDRLTE